LASARQRLNGVNLIFLNQIFFQQ